MKILLCLLILWSKIYGQIEIWHFKDIYLEELSVIKKVENVRTIYRGDDFYLKIWEENSIHFEENRNQTFLEGVNAGLFDEIGPLRGVVLNEENKCCGYVTWPCEIVEADAREIQTRNNFFKRLKDKEMLLIVKLYGRVRQQALKTGYCITKDYRGSWNLGMLNGKCYLIDLDNVSLLEEVKSRHNKLNRFLIYMDSRFADYN